MRIVLYIAVLGTAEYIAFYKGIATDLHFSLCGQGQRFKITQVS